MTRRCFLFAAPALLAAGVGQTPSSATRPPGRVSADPDPRELFGALASALSERDARDFIHHFDSAMPDLDALQSNVEALVDQADVISSIDFVSQSQDKSDMVVEVDWAMTLQSRAAAAGGPTERRRRVLTVRLRRQGSKWKVVSLNPLEFFEPPRFQ